MAIRLVAVDLDGTLLSPRGAVTPATQQAVRSAVQHGFPVALCTGRPLRECRLVLEALPEVEYAVTSTAGRVLNVRTMQELGGVTMRPEQAARFYHILEEFDNVIDFLADGQVRFDAARMTRIAPYLPKGSEAHMRLHYTEWNDLSAFVDTFRKPVDKLFSLYVSQQERDRAWARLQGEDCFLSSSGPRNLEITAPGADKGAGLAILAKHLGIDASEIVAIGDSSNDEQMLRYVGVPVAMGNALPEIKALCAAEAPSNAEDGVAFVLNQLVKGEFSWNCR